MAGASEIAGGRRIFVTGGSGFIGRAVVRHLLGRGDTVTSLVRDRRRGPAETLEEPAGLTLVRGDTTGPVEWLAARMAGHDGLIHLAGSYRIGIDRSERPAMFASNVTATARVLDAAIDAGVPRIVTIGTANVMGDTHGLVVDETYRRDPAEGFLSWYDETKVRAHELALERIARGAPIMVALPGAVYGPGDHSGVGQQIRGAFDGTLRYRTVDSAGTCLVHVDDEADGIVRVLDRGRIGELYLLGGATQRLGEAIAMAARLGGRRPPRLSVPPSVLRLIVPVAPHLGGRFDVPVDLGEVIRASEGVTYWVTSSKAELELGFHARDLETGLRDWLLGGRAATDGGSAPEPGDGSGAPG
jgi:dihydroflavonol-4-reductase